LKKTSPIRNLVKSTEDNKVLNLKSESFAEPLTGLSSNVRETVLEEAGGV
jgi:hypothetical protein